MENHQTSLKVGDKAPVFTGLDQNGQRISLANFKGKKLVIYFYPKDNTPGCTAESCDLRDNYARFQHQGYDIVGVSADDAVSHQKFIAKFDLPFPLIADTDLSVIKAFDVWGYKKFMGKEYDGISRTTFVIDEQGILEQVITKVDTKEHSNQIL
jgi:thioredoxin-dependent peroxiredoxin